MKSATLPRLFTIDPGTPFLETVAHALASGHLIKGFRYGGDALALADATIYVPTRRAARELRSAFVDVTGGETCLLPTIRPLGEFDNELDLFAAHGEKALSIPPAIDPLNRQILLGRLVLEWTKHLARETRDRLGEEDITTPVSTSDAFWLASDLGQLLDQMQAEGKTIAEAADAVASGSVDVSQWWQVTMAFLQIIDSEWPALLAERGRLDPAEHRNRMIRAEVDRLRQNPPDYPVIVAGSTGSIKATAELMGTIAHLPKGAVVLPGFEMDMSDTIKAQLQSLHLDTPANTHPQAGLIQLLRQIGADQGLVTRLGNPLAAHLRARKDWVSASMQPAAETGSWLAQRRELNASAFDAVTLLDAPSDALLANAIAVSLREAIRDGSSTAALVTPDRGLARRVSVALASHGIRADDSAGIPFSQTGPGELLALVLKVALESVDPSSVLALLKHRLVRLGETRKTHLGHVSHFEHSVMRGGRGQFEAGTCRLFAEERLSDVPESGYRQPPWLERYGAEVFEHVRCLADRLDAALAPLVALGEGEQDVSVQNCVIATIHALEQLARDDADNHDTLYEGEDGKSLETLLLKLAETEPELTFPAAHWPAIIASLVATRTVRFPSEGHPRVFIWGTLEARLQHVDHMVLGGLNEGTWPQVPDNDAFVTRSQKQAIGMMPPERRIGLSAHDFQMAMGQPSVVLARARRADGTPTVASRWWQRLTALAGPHSTARMIADGDALIQKAVLLDAVDAVPPISRPCPKPAVHLRPRRLSVTAIDTLITDPYAIYARHILKLHRVEELVRDPDASDRGRLFHDIFERAVTQDIDFDSDHAAAQLSELADAVFGDANLPAAISAIWRPRLDALIDNYIAWERHRNLCVAKRHAEVSAFPTPLGETGVELTGRADRIDTRIDGHLDIVDYKTGGIPTQKAVMTLQAIQLPLEAALAQMGAFDGISSSQAGDLIYVQLGARGEVAESVNVAALSEKHDLAGDVWQKTVALLTAYRDVSRGYLSKARPTNSLFAGDYDHLARISEWRVEANGTTGGAPHG